MQRISRREFVKRTAFAGAMLTSIPALIEACTSGSNTTSKTTKLTIAAVQGAEDGPLKKVAPMYQSQTGITMEVVEFPYDQLFEKLVTTFQANGSSYDLCMMDDPWMPKFGTMGALQPLDSNFGFTRDSDIPSIVYDVGTWPPPHGPVPPSEQGKSKHLYGITIVGNVEMFMYRKDLASTAPASWNDVLANAQKFNKSNFYGYVIRGKATNPASSDSLPILWSFGGDIFDSSWKVVLDSTASIDAITFLTQTLKKYAEPGAENTDAADRDRLIAIGQAFQSTTWPAEVTGVVEAAGVSQVAGKMAYIPIPQGPGGKGLGMMGNWLLGIPKGSHPNPHELAERPDPWAEQSVLSSFGAVFGRTAELAATHRPVECGRDDLWHRGQPGRGGAQDAKGCADGRRRANSHGNEAGRLPLLA